MPHPGASLSTQAAPLSAADSPLSHRWGYSGPLDEKGVPDVTRIIHVDPSRPLPDSHLAIDVAYAKRPGVRVRFEALEGRLNAFGYSFRSPFVTGCPPELRQRAACPVSAAGGRHQ